MVMELCRAVVVGPPVGVKTVPARQLIPKPDAGRWRRDDRQRDQCRIEHVVDDALIPRPSRARCRDRRARIPRDAEIERGRAVASGGAR